MPKKPFVYMDHGRSDEQKANMERIRLDGVDPFDWENLPQYHEQPIMRTGIYWLITPNEYPYEGTKLHLLLIYKDAVKLPSETAPEAWKELGEHMSWIEKEFELKGGTLLMRFGDPALTGGTVDHLHLHVIVGSENSAGKEKIKASVGYKA